VFSKLHSNSSSTRAACCAVLNSYYSDAMEHSIEQSTGAHGAHQGLQPSLGKTSVGLFKSTDNVAA
jgi:hypothetical protein